MLSTDPTSLPHLLEQLFSVEKESGQTSRKVGSKCGSAGSSKHRTKRKAELRAKVAVLDTILNGMLTHVVVMAPPPHIQASLLRILADVDHVVRRGGGEKVFGVFVSIVHWIGHQLTCTVHTCMCNSFFFGKVTTLGVLCCFALLFV